MLGLEPSNFGSNLVAQNENKKPSELVGDELPAANFDLGQSAAVDMSQFLQPAQQTHSTGTVGQPRILHSRTPAIQSGVSTVKASTTFSEPGEDEISTFFKNRQLANKSSRGKGFFSKVALIAASTALSSLLLWNYSDGMRIKVQKYGVELANVNLAAVMPAWSRKAKAFKRETPSELVASRGDKPAFGSNKDPMLPPVELMYSNVEWGNWPVVENFIRNSCSKWVVDYPCSVRAWYLAYRGMKGVLRPVQVMDLKAPKLPPNTISTQRIRAAFLFAKSTSATGAVGENFFNEAMLLLGKDSAFKIMLFDARFKNALHSGRRDEISKMSAIIPSLNASPDMIAKWSLMDNSARLLIQFPTYSAESSAIAKKNLGPLVTKAAGAIYRDAEGLLTLQKNLLRLGLGKDVLKISRSFEEFQGIGEVDSRASHLDPELRLDYDTSYVRAALLDKNKNAAVVRLNKMRDRKQMDSIGRHLQASIYLDSQLNTDGALAVAAFNSAIAAHDSWQSEAGYLLALTKTGNLNDAKKVAVKLQRLSNPGNADRVTIAISEFQMAIAKGSGAKAASRYAEVAATLGAVFARHPTWTKLASLYASALSGANKTAAAQAILLKNDVILSKTSYFSSPEYITSPFGPLALMD